MKKLTEAELKKLQKINIDMAKCFVQFCKKHNLTCYLCGGGCIGTVRHQGMIPWDDDLDFFMPRKDYERAWRLWRRKSPNPKYVLEKSDACHVDHNLFFTIRDKDTTYIRPYQENLDITHGVILDVIPLDGYPDNKMKRMFQCFWALIYSLYCSQVIPEKHGKLMAFLGTAALRLVPSKRVRYCIWRMAEKKMTKYPIEMCSGITELCTGPGYMKNWYPREAFEKAVFLPFEDGEMPVPIGYDAYLRTAFGDYMKLPPEEKRVGHHEAVFMDLDRSYKEYRHIYYLKEE